MTVFAGTIIPYGGTSVPSGYLFCDGSAVSRLTYATLFGVIGTTYGAGNGTTTFNVPDLRGRVVAGQDDMGGSSANRLTGQSGGVDGDGLGNAGGLETHTLITAEMPSHTHNFQFTNMGRDSSLGQYVDQSSDFSETSVVFTTASTGGSGAHNNVQPTLILNYIIATQDTSGSNIGQLGIVIDGGGQTITTGNKGYLYCAFAGTLTAATLIADQSGSCVIDIWKASYPTVPTVANTITASAIPTLSSQQVSQNTTLTGWTAAVAAGDVFGFNVNSATTITRVALTLTINKS